MDLFFMDWDIGLELMMRVMLTIFNESSNTIMDNQGNRSVTSQQKAKAVFVPQNAEKGNIYRKSAENSFSDHLS